MKDTIDLLNLYQTQYSQVDKLWGYFTTITLAVLAFTIESDNATKSFSEAVIIILGYVVFCVGNFTALQKGQRQLDEFATLCAQKAHEEKLHLDQLVPVNIRSVSWFYWCVVLAVCGGILFIMFWRNCC